MDVAIVGATTMGFALSLLALGPSRPVGQKPVPKPD
jgi:hypothetical protein